MKFTDTATLSGTRVTEDGYLVAEAFAVRTGIQIYAGSEVGLADRDMVRVYRPESEVRSTDSMATWSHAPVTLGHPDVMVDAGNFRDYARGEVSTEAEWQDNKIKFPLIVKDQDAVKAIQSGVRELSAGYTCTLDFTDGVTPEGEQYDAIQKNIRINHLAIVPKGRAGSECRIGDDAHKWGASPSPATVDRKGRHMADDLQTVVLGDTAAQVAVADASKVEAFKDAMTKKLSDAEKAHEEAIADKDKEIATKDAKIEELEGAQLSDADLDARVEARAALIDSARKIAKDVETKGLSDEEIRKAAVVAKLGDEAVKDKAQAYIDARFDILLEGVSKQKDEDPFARTMADVKPNVVALDAAYEARDNDLQNAWMGAAKKEA